MNSETSNAFVFPSEILFQPLEYELVYSCCIGEVICYFRSWNSYKLRKTERRRGRRGVKLEERELNCRNLRFSPNTYSYRTLEIFRVFVQLIEIIQLAFFRSYVLIFSVSYKRSKTWHDMVPRRVFHIAIWKYRKFVCYRFLSAPPSAYPPIICSDKRFNWRFCRKSQICLCRYYFSIYRVDVYNISLIMKCQF